MAAATLNERLQHPCFPQPENNLVLVWRYLDLAKLIWLLDTEKLHFSRLDLLNDPHEGAIPPLLALLRDQEFRQSGAGHLLDQAPRINEQSRRASYVSCWHRGNAESEAMWRLYCPNDSGVAIQTTYEKLVLSIEHDPGSFIGNVTYIDYESQGFPLNNLFYPIMHKRASFAHENEVRIVKVIGEHVMTPGPGGPPSVTLDWTPAATIDSIYVNPYAPEFYFEVVRTILHRVAPTLETKLRWSPMRGAPTY